ncbi:MAG TPA: dienelactone hydrolase family protein [Pyrinomonadaceae bacterium]|jgi:carboxymethylenebutenolidase
MKHSRPDDNAPHVSRRKFITQATALGGAGLAAAASTNAHLAAQDNKMKTESTPQLGTMVEFKSGDLTIPAYLVRPPKKKTAPAVLVIHEVFGLNDHIKSIADRIAREGYVTLAPNFFVRATATPPKDASDMQALRRAASSIPPEAAIKDMQAALDYLKADKGVKRARLASIGFCMGGGFSYQIATHTQDLAGAVIFYGRTPIELAPQVSCPLLASFGGKDTGIPPAQVQAWLDALKQAGKSVDAKIYPDAGHGFFNDTRPQAYNAEAAADAWQRTLKFFHERLGK